MRVADVHGEVGVGVGELGKELGAVRLVDALPEGFAALVECSDVVRFAAVSESGQGESVDGSREGAHRRGLVERPPLTSSGMWSRSALRLLMTRGIWCQQKLEHEPAEVEDREVRVTRDKDASAWVDVTSRRK